MSSLFPTPMERVLTTLSYREPDRVPLFLLLSLHGAKELGLSIKDYFSKPEHVVEGQLRLREKYGHDCLYGFYYGAIEAECWGVEVIFSDDGPPNSGEPFLRKPQDIEWLEPPSVSRSPCLQRVLQSIAGMKARVGDEVPIIGVVMSPFSLPVMQMGFETYIELIYEQPKLLAQLMRVNEAFCVDWANAQLRAGATAICYFDPISSPTMIEPEVFRRTGFEVAKWTISRIEGPVATHLASGRCLRIADDLVETGAAVVGVSALEDLADLKAAFTGRATVLGNLNGVEMRRWTAEETTEIVKDALAKAAPGGGFILSDNHGEIPWQVPDDVLHAISSAVRRWGHYPLKWVPDER